MYSFSPYIMSCQKQQTRKVGEIKKVENRNKRNKQMRKTQRWRDTERKITDKKKKKDIQNQRRKGYAYAHRFSTLRATER